MVFSVTQTSTSAVQRAYTLHSAFAGLPRAETCGSMKAMRRVLLLLAFVRAALGAEPPETLARFVSAEWRAADERRAALQRALADLPPQPPDQTAERIGWHSRYGSKESKSPRSLIVDLGANEMFDAVVLVPVNVPQPTQRYPATDSPCGFASSSSTIP